MMAATDYGPLTDLVKYAGILISAAGAIGLTWRRRAKWEPSEQDVPSGAAKVAGLLTAIVIAVIWTQYSTAAAKPELTRISLTLGVVCVVFLLVYGYLIAQLVYVQAVSPKKNQVINVKIIGGFALTRDAKKHLREAGSIQRLFEGAGYDPDLVWTRASRAFAKQLFVLCFIGLNVSGTIALSCAALLLLLGSAPQGNA